MSDEYPDVERLFREAFPVRSELKSAGVELKPRTGKVLRISGDIIDGPLLGLAAALKLIKAALPKDAYLFDNGFTLKVSFPYPAFSANGTGNWSDEYGVIFASNEWVTHEENYRYPMLKATFSKDPTTWAITCKITEENDK